jgi:prephenate dehydrogenase
MTKKIGVVGLGDLGNQLALQLVDTDYELVVWDTNPGVELTTNIGAIDSSKHLPVKALQAVSYAPSLDLLLDECDIIHWAVPSRHLDSLPTTKKGKIIVLHDSVMQNNVDAVSGRDDYQNFVFAHCLMNDSLRVLIAKDNGPFESIFDHMTLIGLRPEYITQPEHDVLMARTQGVFALLIELGMAEELSDAHKNGNLTPSAEELYHAVMNRESRWTRATIDSILANPMLKDFVTEIASALEKKDKTE